jgi:hypothetical protein
METTFTLSRYFAMTPFALMEQDCDEVIMILNHFINKSSELPKEDTPKQKDQRIRVNDKTASGGWF